MSPLIRAFLDIIRQVLQMGDISSPQSQLEVIAKANIALERAEMEIKMEEKKRQAGQR